MPSIELIYARRHALFTPSLAIGSALDNEPYALDRLLEDRARIDGAVRVADPLADYVAGATRSMLLCLVRR
jgi:hypothetical protein